MVKKKNPPQQLQFSFWGFLLRHSRSAALQPWKVKLQHCCYFWGCFSRTHGLFWDAAETRDQTCRARSFSGWVLRYLQKMEKEPWHIVETSWHFDLHKWVCFLPRRIFEMVEMADSWCIFFWPEQSSAPHAPGLAGRFCVAQWEIFHLQAKNSR